jgi:hypothetical protein
MKLDYKMLLNTAIGVAVGMVAYHFITKAMTANGGTVGAIGKVRPLRAHRDWCLCNEGWQTECGGNCATCCEGHGGVRPPYIK